MSRRLSDGPGTRAMRLKRRRVVRVVTYDDLPPELQDAIQTRDSLFNVIRHLYRAKILWRPSLVRDLFAAGGRVRESGNLADAIPMLLNQDPPEHRDYRDATRRHFTPSALTSWHNP